MPMAVRADPHHSTGACGVTRIPYNEYHCPCRRQQSRMMAGLRPPSAEASKP